MVIFAQILVKDSPQIVLPLTKENIHQKHSFFMSV